VAQKCALVNKALREGIKIRASSGAKLCLYPECATQPETDTELSRNLKNIIINFE